MQPNRWFGFCLDTQIVVIGTIAGFLEVAYKVLPSRQLVTLKPDLVQQRILRAEDPERWIYALQAWKHYMYQKGISLSLDVPHQAVLQLEKKTWSHCSASLR